MSKKCLTANNLDFLDALTASDDEFRIGSSGSGMFCQNVKIKHSKDNFYFLHIDFSFISEDEGLTVVLAAPKGRGEFVIAGKLYIFANCQRRYKQ